MHVTEAKIQGGREIRLYHIAIWRESPGFTPREKAALAWTGALTMLAPQGVTDEIYASVLAQISEGEMSNLGF